jgi:UDP-GlcNAc:undecaprenyl-phosphate GlcNAc-1-phosphate transferase
MDKPNSRKVHAAPMPLLGGLAIYASFLVALLLFRDWPQHLIELGAIIAGATVLALLGMVDDKIGLSPRTKFPVMFIVAGFAIATGIQIELTYNPLIDGALSVLWIVGLINAINFMDNMDGLAAGTSAIAAGFIFILAASQKQELVSTLAAALCGSAIGFLIYNFNPATTFMGDTGSLPLGFLLAVLGIKLRFSELPKETSWMIPILVLGLPIFDTTLVFFTRIREGRSPFQGGKDHTSHRLTLLGLTHRQVVLTLYGVVIALGLAALVISQLPEPQAAWAMGIGMAGIGVAVFIGLEWVWQRSLRLARSKTESG